MKKTLALILALAMIFAMAVTAFADDEQFAGTFDFNENDGSEPAKTEYHFVYIPKLVHPYFDAIRDGMLEAVEDYKAKGVEITLDYNAPANADAMLQIEKLEAAAAQGVDAIGVAMQDPTMVNPVLGEIQASGIPVCTTDEGDTTTFNERKAFVGLKDLYADGCTLGEAIAEKLNYEGKVAMLIGTKSAWAHTERTRGLKDTFAKYPGIEIVAEYADEDDMQKALELTEQMLTAYPDIDAITSSNGGAHVGAAKAVKDAGKAGEILIGGYDAIQETVDLIREGVIYCAVAQDCRSTGYWLIQEMIDAADGKIEEPREYYVGTFVLSNETMDLMPQYGYNF